MDKNREGDGRYGWGGAWRRRGMERAVKEIWRVEEKKDNPNFAYYP